MGFQLSHQTQIPSLHNFLLAMLHFLPFFVFFFFLILFLCFGGRDYVDIQFKKIHKNKREKFSQTNSLLQVPRHQKLSLTLAWAKGQRCQGWRDSLSSWLRRLHSQAALSRRQRDPICIGLPWRLSHLARIPLPALFNSTCQGRDLKDMIAKPQSRDE